jgi:RNA polymerase sigma factor (sigma-70 family)
MEVSALRYSGGIGLHGRSPLLRLQSDERLVALIRRGSTAAFEVLVSRYHSRLLAFCRHLLGSREDAEDVLQEVFSAAFNAILDDDRPINVRPWLYRIARNRSLNHLRRIQAVGVDSMDIHLFEHGTTTADKVHDREEFRLLVGDIQALPETQRTALVLREMDALSYEQIAEAMETTVPSVKSLLVRARVSLAEAAQARMLTCEDVRVELGEVAEGLRRRPGPLVRRHLRTCERCSTFKSQLNETSKALTALLPIGFGPVLLLRKLAILHIGHSAGAGSSASGAGAAGQAAAVGSTAAAGAASVVGSGTGGLLSASVGAIATKAAAGLAAAALVTAGAVEVSQPPRHRPHPHATAMAVAMLPKPATAPTAPAPKPAAVHVRTHHAVKAVVHKHTAVVTAPAVAPPAIHKPAAKTTSKHAVVSTTKAELKTKDKSTPKVPAGHTQTHAAPTVLPALTTTSTAPTTTVACSSTSAGEATATSTAPASATTPTTTTTSAAVDPGQSAAGDPGRIAAGDPGQSAAGDPGRIAAGDPGQSTATDPGQSPDSSSSAGGTETTTTVITTPAPAPAPTTTTSCSSDTSVGSGAAPAGPSGGVAP